MGAVFGHMLIFSPAYEPILELTFTVSACETAAPIHRAWSSVRPVSEFASPPEIGVTAGMLVEHARLADQIQADVGHGDIFFQGRAVAAPLCIALAQRQGVVGQMQQIVKGSEWGGNSLHYET